jgi:hypothetical protein
MERLITIALTVIYLYSIYYLHENLHFMPHIRDVCELHARVIKKTVASRAKFTRVPLYFVEKLTNLYLDGRSKNC